LDSSFEKGLFLTFPSFSSKAIVGSDDIYLDMTPCLSENHSGNASSTPLDLESTFCRDITQRDHLSDDTCKHDNILKELRCYYQDVKSKRKIGLPVPAGSRPQSHYQRQIILHTPPRKSAKGSTNPFLDLSSDVPSDDPTLTPVHSNRTVDILSADPTIQAYKDDTPPFIPIIRSVDIPSSSLPKCVSMTEDYLRSCVGYRRIDTLKKNLACLYQPTITLDHTPPDAILDPGFYATLRKKDRSTIPVPRPSRFGNVFHLDIVCGPEVSIGNVHYGLLCVDRFSHMTYMYPL
jgi:hypothetical protein